MAPKRMRLGFFAALLFAVSAFAQTTNTTINVPLSVSVVAPTATTAGKVTVSIGSQTSIVPIAAVPPVVVLPPACGPQPASTVSTQQCPSGTTGTWPQTTNYTSANAPLCWAPIVTPTIAPSGACTPVVIVTPPSVGANCGQQLGGPVTFCETFDAPSTTPGPRAAALNGNVWGVSRSIGDGVNFGGQAYNQWNATQIAKCDGTTPTVVAPNDIIICAGQLREAVNDNNSLQTDAGTVTSLAMYPKQPFDFAGRTGTVSFDVSNDTSGNHGAWPEFWLTSLPSPIPFNHFDSWEALPQDGLAIRFASSVGGGQQGACPNANNLGQKRWSVDSAAVINALVLNDSSQIGPTPHPTVTILDCVIESTGPGSMNHVEIQIAQNLVKVFASDAGSTKIRPIAAISNISLTLTRGLIWLEDVHYNADKGAPAWTTQRQHTFSWDNVSFDGPFTYRDFAYDSPDNTTPGPNGSVNLAKFSQANAQSSWSIPGVPANPQAAAVRVLFSFNSENRPNPTKLTVTVNGNVHTVPWPYPDELVYSWRTYALTIPVTDLVAGTNIVQLGGDVAEIFANVDIVLVNVGGGVPILPGSNNAYPGT